MSDENNKNKNDDNDPYNFFKLSNDQNNNDNKKNDKKGPKLTPFILMTVIMGVLLIVMNMYSAQISGAQVINFSTFCEKLENGEIVRVEITDSEFPTITGYTTKSTVKKYGWPVKSTEEETSVYSTSGILDNRFFSALYSHDIDYKVVPRQPNYLLQFLWSFGLPILVLVLIYMFIFKKMTNNMSGMGSVFGAGASKSRAVDEGKVKTRFSDVAGVDEAKDELVEVVDFLKSPKKYTDIGGKIPKGVLLVGPPGTGKTLLARAVAGEAGVPFFSISGSDFVEMFVGVGASRVRDLFKQAREKAPCIVFIDEIDALGKSRMNGFGGGNDEREQTLNQLLVEMDGFENEKGLIILAATNRADVLDPALLRPGRFDRQVPVERPDVKGREEILRIHAKNVKLDEDVDFESVAHGTTGFAGADLANVVNEAALLAVRNGRKRVTMEDFNEAIDKVSIGLKKKSRKDNKKEMRLVSVHETGHALVGAFTPDYPPVNKITVVPRSHGVGGFTQYREKEESFLKTRKDMLDEVDTLLGGRAAEQIIFNDITTGASNDIARATEIIKSMIVDFGMSDRFKNMTLGKGVLKNASGEPSLVREFSEETQNYIDEEISRLMEERYAYVLKLLKDHKDLLEYISNRLVEVETMEGTEFYDIIKGAEHCAVLEKEAVKAIEASEEKPKTKRTRSAKPKAESSEKDEKPKAKRTSKKTEK